MELINQDALIGFIEKLVDQRVTDQLDRHRKIWEAERGDRLLGRIEVAERLNVSVGTLDNLRERGRIKSVDVGNLVKFRETELLRYINSLK